MVEDKPQDQLLTPEEAAARLKMSRLTIGDWLRSGKLQGVKVGRLWRVRESELEVFLKGGEHSVDTEEKARASRLRKQAARQGYGIKKSRAGLSVDNHGGYMVYDLSLNAVMFGARFDATLDDIEAFLKEK
jgi:excisionase family DNA binding protein